MPPSPGDLRQRMVEIVGGEQVQSGTGAAGFSVGGVVPPVVVHPRSQDEVAAVMAACGKAGAALVCRGGGAALELGNPPSRLEVMVCLDRLARIVELDDANLNVSAEAGVRLVDLQAALAQKRLHLPLDPAQPDRVTVGGLVAVNASGPSRLLYGTARDWVLGLRVVLANGERTRCGGKVVKNVSGYDMNKLFIGSLGTLGIVTEATFKLLPAPVRRATIVALFRELAQAASVVARILESQLLPEAVEALDPQALASVAPALGLSGASGYGLAVSVAGSRETVERQVRDFTRLFAEGGAAANTALEEARCAAAWRAIGDAPAKLGGTPGQTTIVKISVPIGKTLEFFASAERLARRAARQGVVTAHAASGIVRAGFLVDEPSAGPLREGLEGLRSQVEAAEGSLVVEAAAGALRRSFDAWGKPREALTVMRRLKTEFDPQGLLAPGRFVGGL
jgi:glycolate oxidase FAD binding subunit